MDSIVEQDKVSSLLQIPALGGGCAIASFCAFWAHWNGLHNWLIMSVVMFGVTAPPLGFFFFFFFLVCKIHPKNAFSQPRKKHTMPSHAYDMHPHARVRMQAAYSTMWLAVEVLEASMFCLFSCFAEEPQLLCDTHPIIFHRFVRISEYHLFKETQPLSAV